MSLIVKPYLKAILASLGALIFGLGWTYHQVVLDTALHDDAASNGNEESMSNSRSSIYVPAYICLGAITGAIATCIPMWSNKIYKILSLYLPLFIGVILSFGSHASLAQFFLGVSGGGFQTAVPLYLHEIAERHYRIRGKLAVIFNIMFCLGDFLFHLCRLYAYSVAMSILLTICTVAAFAFTFWYINRANEGDAVPARDNNVRPESPNHNANEGFLTFICQKPFCKSCWLLVGVFAMPHLSGLGFIINNSEHVLQGFLDNLELGALTTALLLLSSLLCFCFIADKCEPKTGLLLSSGCMVSSSLMCGITYSDPPNGFVALWFIVFLVGFGIYNSILYQVMAEISPRIYKSFQATISILTYWAFSFLPPSIYSDLENAIGVRWTCFVFAVTGFFGFGCLFRHFPETLRQND